MTSLQENIFNSRRRRDEKKFKLWKYAGLMLTYKCSAACAFCYYNCSPDKGGLMKTETAVGAWESLERLAGARASVHITGGEPFLYADRLAEVLNEAKRMGLRPADSVETNASWAVSSSVIERNVRLLKDAGVERLKISWDPFHAEYISTDKIKRLASAAEDILGRERVLVRWADYLDAELDFAGMTEEEKQAVYKSAMGDYPCRLTGRAAGRLGHLAERKPLEIIQKQNCRRTWMDGKGVHIDPYGNIFSGLCSGIIVGNVEDRSLEDIWRSLDIENEQMVARLVEAGPAGLLNTALEAGYEVRGEYAGKCHLCTDIRQFFFDNGRFQGIIGPLECYTD
ncbi:molybdenum cofactor biosynthesis protein A [Anaerohalosphaera lusitana]|uniref:Molybdenum cofactor biosynthesis protein A n=1 Tax=Anaerohalosphaera lusitana TaxID=1936003 RepID=A0A1U9NN67_9BACT|nr:radical SAM/SPASM domain-containing protein [Anaerohalosphaera lusitana]AQT69343.1 molybdenum cofactor biosynthesis protein A [Anaerohalosphaera lusitana]